MSRTTARPYKRLLIANRGEIAARVNSTARELGLDTFTCYTDNDVGHTYNSSHAIRLTSPSSYTDIDEILRIARQHAIEAVHPAYGYLSESPDLAKRLEDAGIAVVGPGPDILASTGDKLQARLLAEECAVPVLPALTTPTSSVEHVEEFVREHGLPVMVKAVDGGGGRGIRLIRTTDDLQSLARRAIEESPSKQVFAERAAVDGFRHVEVQIIGDGNGNVIHLWERECSIQRRYQKIVEMAPSTVPRRLVAPVIEAAVRMAKKINYRSLGTFEFLLNPSSGEFFFLEINPRLQVEHTITETICSLDIVEIQLRLSMGSNFDSMGLDRLTQNPLEPPDLRSLQFRVTAEDPERNWVLSTGKITSFRLPLGNGVRVDSALLQGSPNVVSADFDSVVAKIIVSAATWDGLVRRSRRALDDMHISGIRTNLDILRAIVASPDFEAGSCDTTWLESKHSDLLAQSRELAANKRDPLHGLAPSQSQDTSSISMSASANLFRRDDAWSVALTPLPSKPEAKSQDHHLRLHKVLKNDFPSTLRAQLTWTSPASEPQDYLLELKATAASAAAVGAQHRRGDPRDASHVIIPFAGKLIEVCVDEGDTVKKGDCIAVVQQMKMELEVRSHADGVVTWLCDIADGDDVAEGVLAAIVDDSGLDRPKL